MSHTGMCPCFPEEIRKSSIQYIKKNVFEGKIIDIIISNLISTIPMSTEKVDMTEDNHSLTTEFILIGFTLPYIKQLASGNLLYDAGTPKLVFCDNLEMWDGEGNGRED